MFFILDPEWSYIIDRFTGLFLSVKGSSLETRRNDGSGDQLWAFDSTEQIVNQGSGLVIDGSGSSPALREASSITNGQRWNLRTDIQSSQENIVSVAPKLATEEGSCLNTANRFLDGSPVIMYPCSGVHPDNAGWAIVSAGREALWVETFWLNIFRTFF